MPSQFLAFIVDTEMIVVELLLGTTILDGEPLLNANVAPGTEIEFQIAGTPGGVGAYNVSIAQTVPATIMFTSGIVPPSQRKNKVALPANVRVNSQFPFPSLVTGSGPITIAKQNGIWQVGFQIASFGVQNPPAGNYATDYTLFYDSIAKTFFRMSISNLLASITPAGPTRLQRSVTASPIVVQGTDQIINSNIAGAVANVALPQASTRAGVPLSFEDLGQATAHPITLVPFAGDTIFGANSGANYVLNMNLQGVTLVPFNDATNSGWKVS